MSERTEDASSKKLQDAHKKGQVVKSNDLIVGIIFFMAFYILTKTGTWIFLLLLEFYKYVLSTLPQNSLDLLHLENDKLLGLKLYEIAVQGCILIIKTTLPIAAAVIATAIIANIAISGFVFTTEPLMPDLEKFNPINNLQQRFSMKAIIESVKMLLKTMIATYLIYRHLKDPVLIQAIFLSFRINILSAMLITIKIIIDLTYKIIYFFIFIGLVDFAYQRYQYFQEMMMTKSEVKQEYKESEGDPRMKSERKRFGRELIFSASPLNIKQSKVIVSNPTHIAVGISYDSETIKIPVISVKGFGETAQNILHIAYEHKVPILRDPDLAWALIDTPIQHIIPEKTFDAIAAVFHALNTQQALINTETGILDPETIPIKYIPT